MHSRINARRHWPTRWGRAGVAAVSLVALAGAGFFGFGLTARRSPAISETLPRAVARRTDLFATVRAPGRVDSSKNTLIECGIEATYYSNEGRTVHANGSTAILSIVPDGTMVKAGDVLCRLNSAQYEELVRLQTIELEESRAEYEGAQLDLEADVIRLREYQEGLLAQLKQQYQSKIVLAEAENKRQEDRVVWTEKMVGMKYVPTSRLSLENQMLQKTQIEQARSKLALSNLLKYTGPKTISGLEARLESRKSELNFRKLRLEQQTKRLAKFKEQVELCTVRAPHDGFLIYANDDDDDARIEEGATVRQKQDMFYLPDLTKMEVFTTFHESIVRRIKEGMQAVIRIEAMPQARLEGHVVSVSPLPASIRSWSQSDEIKNFMGTVQLHAIPQGLLPGMTAEVEVLTAQVANAVVVPPDAVTQEKGHDICYVAGAQGIERREVELGEATPSMIEVRSGIDEGEQVVLYPADTIDPELRDSLATPSPTHTAQASQPATDLEQAAGY